MLPRFKPTAATTPSKSLALLVAPPFAAELVTTSLCCQPLDSLPLTVLGDKGADTILFGEAPLVTSSARVLFHLATRQRDSLDITGRMLTSTVQGGEGNDTINIVVNGGVGRASTLTPNF